MYTDLWELISLYSVRPKDYRPEADSALLEMLAESERKIIRNEQFNLQGFVHLHYQENRKQHFVLWIPDRYLENIGTVFMKPPLTQVAECNYNWYKLYLNLVAYLSGYPVGKLRLQLLARQNRLVEVAYRPEVMARLLQHYQNRPSEPIAPAPLRPVPHQTNLFR